MDNKTSKLRILILKRIQVFHIFIRVPIVILMPL